MRHYAQKQSRRSARSAQESPDFWALCEHRTGNQCPTLGRLMPIAWSVDARRLVSECPLDGQDRPPDGLLRNSLCDFIPNPACQSFFLFIVCIGILYIQEE